MSTQHSRGWQHNDMCVYVNRALKGLTDNVGVTVCGSSGLCWSYRLFMRELQTQYRRCGSTHVVGGTRVMGVTDITGVMDGAGF